MADFGRYPDLDRRHASRRLLFWTAHQILFLIAAAVIVAWAIIGLITGDPSLVFRSLPPLP